MKKLSFTIIITIVLLLNVTAIFAQNPPSSPILITEGQEVELHDGWNGVNATILIGGWVQTSGLSALESAFAQAPGLIVFLPTITSGRNSASNSGTVSWESGQSHFFKIWYACPPPPYQPHIDIIGASLTPEDPDPD